MARSWRIMVHDIAKVFERTLRDEGENIAWMEDIRGNLAMVATVIATVTFQIGLNPPGGVVQSGDRGDVSCSKQQLASGGNYQCPGVSVFADAGERQHRFNVFLILNNLSFASAMVACFFLVTGVPLRRPISILLMSIDMCFSLGMLGIAYCVGVILIGPQNNNFFRHLSIMISVIFFFTILVFFLLYKYLFRTLAKYLKDNRSINGSATHYSADATTPSSLKLDDHQMDIISH
ncbi:hypothetical protein PIB30_046683 [Stylosanthes scabra]|uniref:PGG domain-containing protein n=1 Tax=Stylosanthes scabra TaxID=79078 RepID=A0ABU6TGC2_9FABA|nr:hypothetical protein [Stylosanthes scabra]